MEENVSRSTSLWTASQIRLSCYNLLLSAYLFALWPLYARFVAGGEALLGAVALPLAAFVAGMFVPGVFYARLIESFSRKQLLLVLTVVMAAASLPLSRVPEPRLWLGVALVQGICFGIVQMTAGGTLVNDLQTSQLRTKSDCLFTAFGIAGLPAGLLLGTVLSGLSTVSEAILFGAIPAVLAFFVITGLEVPLRAPLHTPLFSLDRFWQRGVWPLQGGLLPVSVAVGYLLGLLPLSVEGFALMAGGVWGDYLVRRLVFRTADVRAELVCGLILLATSAFLLHSDNLQALYTGYVLLGWGLGLSLGRFLMYFLKFCGHCQRGTLQNTFLLTWKTGLWLGLLLTLCHPALSPWLESGLCLLVALYYVLFLQPWFERKRDRTFKFREE